MKFPKLRLPEFEKALAASYVPEPVRPAKKVKGSPDARRIIAALLRAIEAKERLLSCHRTGRSPSETLWKDLEKAKKAVAQAREFLDE